MQSGILMGVYILTTITLQGIGFLISRFVEYQFPFAGLMTFLILFMSAFGLAWPVAVFIAERGLAKIGFPPEKPAQWVPSTREAPRGELSNK